MNVHICLSSLAVLALGFSNWAPESYSHPFLAASTPPHISRVLKGCDPIIPATIASPEAPRYFSAKERGSELYALEISSKVLRRNCSIEQGMLDPVDRQSEVTHL
jgi:hypothetical protein